LEPADVDDALASAAWRIEERAGTRLLNSQRKAVGPPYRSRVGQDGRMSDQGVLGWAGCTAVERDPQRVSGAWVFRGTRIPVAALFENLEDGISLAEFVELFPGVTPEQARSVLEHAARSTECPGRCPRGGVALPR